MLLLATFLMAFAAACGGDDGPTSDEERTADSIKVAAASDLRTVLSEIKPQIEEACKSSITYLFGSSGQFKAQIEAGADFGLYLSADIQYAEALGRAGFVVPDGVKAYGVGRIALATRSGLEPVERLQDLTRADIRNVAIANPDHAPYGRAAKEALQSSGVYESLSGRLVLGENIRQTTDYVEKGDADAAIVALALVIQGSPASYTLIPADLHEPLLQGGAVLKGSGAETTARCILQYITDPTGQDALTRYGFEPAAQ